MIWLVGGIGLGLAVGWKMVDRCDGLGDWFFRVVITMFFAAFLGLLGSGIGLIAGSILPVDTVVKEISRDSLAALGNKQGLQGAFFLGSGLVKDKLTYHYITVEPNKSFKLKSVDAENAAVFEDTDATPYLLTLQRTALPDIRHVVALYSWPAAYEFHIPEGSVRQGYTVDVR